MSADVLRGLGNKREELVKKTFYEVQVVTTGDDKIALQAQGRELAWAYPSGTTTKRWLVGFTGLDTENDFYVRDRENAVDALEDIGRFYLAVKAGEV
ncbi:hypothetical protein [Mycobacteroides abscessus]